ncbi:MAG: hypothetical protein V8Q17_06130 [Acutalibacteraceae bacterium]
MKNLPEHVLQSGEKGIQEEEEQRIKLFTEFYIFQSPNMMFCQVCQEHSKVPEIQLQPEK